MTEKLPVLYLLARTDIVSMNPGKLAAQVSHASNAFVYHANEFKRDAANNPETNRNLSVVSNVDSFHCWEQSTDQGFGTAICLDGGSIEEIRVAVDFFEALNYIAGIVHDPSYPIRDGKVIHHIPLDTCAYIFIPDKFTDEMCTLVLSKFNLYD